jgi:hypothetical protein
LLYRFGVIDIVRDSNGVVRKVVRKLTGDRWRFVSYSALAER